MKASTLTGKDLDYWMYRHACQVLDKTPADEEFESAHSQGQFHFSNDPTLLQDLLVQYDIRLQMLAGEWLASTSSSSCYGEHPLEAACRLVVLQQFGANLT